jgi:hypothetical protein
MPEQDLDVLAMDIENHGQREPGVLFEGMVLDGWHRYLACTKAGVEFKTVEYDGSDPIAFAISKNLHRRHLNASQRAAAVLAATGWRPHGKAKTAPGAVPTAKALADKAEVSQRTIEQVKQAVTVEPELGEALKAGTLSAKAAAEVAKLPKAKREKAVQAIRRGEEPTLPKPKAVVAGREVEKLYEAVKAELADYKERYETLGETARELQDKLEMFEATEPDEQQKKIAALQKQLQRKDAEIARQRGQISDLNNKCNALIRQVKSLQKAK